MSTRDIEVLNSVTRTLNDSIKGYETCCDVSDDSHFLRSQFQKRLDERRALAEEGKQLVRSLGGEPETEGSAKGAVHRGFLRFTSLFRDDEQAAISALDDGEEFLAEKIEDKLEEPGLSAATQAFLTKAMKSARDGECFADRLEEAS